MARLISEADVERLLDPDALIQGIAEALKALTAGQAIQPLRGVMPFGPSTRFDPAQPPGLLFMKPAQIGDALATKLITLVPDNATRGRPTLIATVLLMAPDTGEVLAVMEANMLTALRTAAATAVAADALSRPDADVVALLGSGVLARSHARLLRRVRRVRELRVWSRNPENVARCAQEIDGVACDSAEQAVRGAAIVCTVSTAAEPILAGRWLEPDALVAAVGAPRPTRRERDDDAMQHPVIADQREAAEKESGDVILSGAHVYAELGEILLGRKARPPAGRPVIFKSLGLAIEDAVAARLVYEAALREAR